MPDPADDTFFHAYLVEQAGLAAAALRRLGVRPGDEVAVHLPLVPEAVVTALACVRLDARRVNWPVEMSARDLADAVADTDAAVVITADAAYWGHAVQPLKAGLDRALSARATAVRSVLVVSRAPRPVPWTPGRDMWWHEALAAR
ncbi:AMP-binding protein [Streptomyces sp. NPDC059740]|uniref:AMP-binding protein n=1 Tax=Streptomyces sp. NPDC059740 TaxID=3346926 RepID=UPI003655DFF8